MLQTQSQGVGGGAGKKTDDTLLEIAKDILSKVGLLKFADQHYLALQFSSVFIALEQMSSFVLMRSCLIKF